MLMHARKVASEAGSELVVDAAREGEQAVLMPGRAR
jgi:hypothetical protein